MAPLLLIGIGNPSRGDDALGPLFMERLEAMQIPGVECMTDFQLQVEYALDLQGRERVIFVDASLDAPPPFAFTSVMAMEDASFSSHELSPQAVLHACQRLFGPPPPAYVLAIRGESFELGEPLSDAAVTHLDAALQFLGQHLSR